jgi:GT2 family glycosyltransferase
MPYATLLCTGHNGGFGRGNNRALENVATPFTLLLNTDARISPGDLEGLETALDRNGGTAAVQPLLRSWEWPLLSVGEGTSMTRYGEGWDMRFMHLDTSPGRPGTEPVPGVSAAASLWRTEALREAGGFDENIFMYFEDVDLCMRLASLGWDFRLARGCRALHRAGASSSRPEAMSWELESSVYLTRRYFSGGSGRLPRYWRRRELRTRLGCLRRGIPWTWRRRSVRNGRKLPCTPVSLPGEYLSTLEARPMDMPLPRPGEPFPLDRDGVVTSGPGLSEEGGRILMKGYGCIETAGPAVLGATVSTGDHGASGAVLDAGGQVLCRFMTGAGSPQEVRFRTGGRAYMRLDDGSTVAEVLDVSVLEEM